MKIKTYQELVETVAKLNKHLQGSPKEPMPLVGWCEHCDDLLDAVCDYHRPNGAGAGAGAELIKSLENRLHFMRSMAVEGVVPRVERGYAAMRMLADVEQFASK